jgi:hydroxymethylbilane synthase
VKLRLGTRGSDLALAQARSVAERLRRDGAEVELVRIRTAGDEQAQAPFAAIGAPGVFVRELQAALLGGQVDCAVHSYKDLPSQRPDGLVVAAVPERIDPADVLLRLASANAPGAPHLPLPPAARVGTSSARRHALLHAARPDLELLPQRGNVPTRIAQLRARRYDAIVLALAGLARLAGGVPRIEAWLGGDLRATRLDPTWFVPAPAQGAIACEARAGDAAVLAQLAQLDEPALRAPLQAERALLARAEAGCQIPFGAWCNRAAGGSLELHAALASDGLVRRWRGRGDEPEALAAQAWSALAGARGGVA